MSELPANTQIKLQFRATTERFELELREHLDNKTFLDCTISCQGQTINVHRLVLSISSCFFKKLLTSKKYTTTDSPVLFFPNIKAHIFEKLVDFMYTKEVTLNVTDLKDFLLAGEKLKIKGLLNATREDLFNKMTKMENLNVRPTSVEMKRVGPQKKSEGPQKKSEGPQKKSEGPQKKKKKSEIPQKKKSEGSEKKIEGPHEMKKSVAPQKKSEGPEKKQIEAPQKKTSEGPQKKTSEGPEKKKRKRKSDAPQKRKSEGPQEKTSGEDPPKNVLPLRPLNK